jgi:hypothetical protein
MRVLGLPATLLVVIMLAGCMQVRSTFIQVANPTPSPAPGFGPAFWALDPTFADPAPETTELHILVWERACNSGTLVVGRMSAPAITYGPTTVMVTMQVRGLGGAQSCPLGPGTPLLVHLRLRTAPSSTADESRLAIAPSSTPDESRPPSRHLHRGQHKHLAFVLTHPAEWPRLGMRIG